MSSQIDSLQPVIEGSKTPRANEKVLTYLEGMSITPPDSPQSQHSSQLQDPPVFEEGFQFGTSMPIPPSHHRAARGDGSSERSAREAMEMAHLNDQLYKDDASEVTYPVQQLANDADSINQERSQTGRQAHRSIPVEMRHQSFGTGPSFGNIYRESHFTTGMPEETSRDFRGSPFPTLQHPFPMSPGNRSRGPKSPPKETAQPLIDFSFDVVPPSHPGSKAQTPSFARSAASLATPREEPQPPVHVGSFQYEHHERIGEGNGFTFASFEEKVQTGRQPSVANLSQKAPSPVATPKPTPKPMHAPLTPKKAPSVQHQKVPTPVSSPRPQPPLFSPIDGPIEHPSYLGLSQHPGRPTSPSNRSRAGSERPHLGAQSPTRSRTGPLFQNPVSPRATQKGSALPPPGSPTPSHTRAMSSLHDQIVSRKAPSLTASAAPSKRAPPSKQALHDKEPSVHSKRVPSPPPHPQPDTLEPNTFVHPRGRYDYGRAPTIQSMFSPITYPTNLRQEVSRHGDNPTLNGTRSPTLNNLQAVGDDRAASVKSPAFNRPPSVGGRSIAEPQRATSPHVQSHSHEIISFAPPLLSPTPADLRIPSPTPSHHIRHHSHEQFEADIKEPVDVITPRANPPPELPPPAEELVVDENELAELLKTPRTGYTLTASVPLDDEELGKYHDEDLCILLHAAEDENQHDVVKKAVRRAVKSRVKKLGLESEASLLRAKINGQKVDSAVYRHLTRHHSHSPVDRLRHEFYRGEQPPPWAEPLFAMLRDAQARLDGLDHKIDFARASDDDHGHHYHEPTDEPNGEFLQHQEEEEDDEEDDDEGTIRKHQTRTTQSPGEQYFEEELYKLRVKQPPRSEITHNTWEVGTATNRHAPPTEFEDDDPDEMGQIPDASDADIGYPPEKQSRGNGYKPVPSPPLPPLPAGASRASQSEFGESHAGPSTDLKQDQTIAFPEPQLAGGSWPPNEWATRAATDPLPPPPWLRVHQRLLNWAIVWPVTELEQASYSTERGHQVEEVALTIWSTQVYKRYVRATLTHSPPGRVDRLFVPPNMADAINQAVFNGRHGDAAGMLRDLWGPFGMDGIPRLLLVLARHRRDENHWVVHKFNLPEGSLITYDTFPKRSLPDGRPLGWWFAIRIAWPNPMYPTPDRLVQRMMRLNRPMQSNTDNATAAAAIWRNLLMGSKPERQLDLDRLRDLMRQEIKNLLTRKNMGKLSITKQYPRWQSITD